MASMVSSSVRSWLMTTAAPRQDFSISATASRPSESRLLVGSSRRMMSGASNTKAASAARVRCPPDSVESSVCADTWSCNPASASASRASSVQSTSASASASASPAMARSSSASPARTPNRSAMVSSGPGCTSWRKTPRRPLTAMLPEVGVSSPEIRRRSVVLPTPLRPTRPVRPAPKLRSRLEKRVRLSGPV